MKFGWLDILRQAEIILSASHTYVNRAGDFGGLEPAT